MNRNYKIWYYIVSAALVICLVFTFSFYNQINKLEDALENNYQSAFADFVTNSENLALLCTKAGIVNTPAQGMALMAQINSAAYGAESALTSLPISQQYIAEMSNYYNQLGDYAQACFKTLSSGKTLDNIQVAQLQSFAEDMENVAVKLQELQSVAYEDDMSFINMPDMGNYLEIENVENTDYNLSSVFTQLNQMFAEKEDLTYAGKYSAHFQNLTALGLSGEMVELETAREKAAEFLQIIGKDYNASALEDNGESNDTATMPAFNFVVREDAGDIYISVSKQGGKILDYYNNRTVIEQVISIDEAYKIAEKVVADCGYDAMNMFKQYKNGNAICFEFSFKDEDEIMYYPDRILVQIALDNGELLAFEAHEYYMYHTERTLAEPLVLQEVAEAGLNSGLEVEKCSMALIANEAGEEILCYEFRVKDAEDSNYIMHISTVDGSELGVFCCIEDEENMYVK